MGRKQKEMSEYEWKQMKRFVSQLCEKFGKGLDQEECEGTAYLEYAEARGEAGNIYDRDFLWERARERTIKAFQQLRRERSGRIRIESKLSLAQPAGGSGEPVYTFLHANHGDFVRWVLLRTDLAKFGETEYKIITGLERGYEDGEIMRYLKLYPWEYREKKTEAGRQIRKYLEEDEVI